MFIEVRLILELVKFVEEEFEEVSNSVNISCFPTRAPINVTFVQWIFLNKGLVLSFMIY